MVPCEAFDGLGMLQQNKGCSSLCGPVAQLGARFHGMEEVIGSIPIRSTKIYIIWNEILIAFLHANPQVEVKANALRCPATRCWLVGHLCLYQTRRTMPPLMRSRFC